MALHLGLDLGGTNIKGVVLDRSSVEPTIVWDGRVETRAREGPHAVVERLGALGEQAVRAAGPCASVGVGVPGLVDFERGIALFLPNLPGDCATEPLAAPLAKRLGAPTAVVNDARAFGLGEATLGAGRGAATVLFVTVGTGIGGAVVVDGRLHLGLAGAAGEIGHHTVVADGPECTCGNRGCVEEFASARAVTAETGKSVEDTVAAARAGDAGAAAAVERAARFLGIAIANAIVTIAPERVVIGGGIAQSGALLFDPLRDELRRRVRILPIEQIEVVPAEQEVFGGAIGAAVWGAERAGA